MTTETLPRRIYFGAEDRPAANMPGPTREAKEGNHAIETGRRHKLADRLIKSAEAVAAAVRIVRALDSTGHTRDALPHLATVVADMNNAYETFLASVTAAFDRHELRTTDPAKIAACLEADLISKDEAEILLAEGAALEASIARHPAGNTPAPKPFQRKVKYPA